MSAIAAGRALHAAASTSLVAQLYRAHPAADLCDWPVAGPRLQFAEEAGGNRPQSARSAAIVRLGELTQGLGGRQFSTTMLNSGILVV